MRGAFLFFIFMMFMTTFFPVVSGQSQALACKCTGVINNAHTKTRAEVCDCYKDRMDAHEKWFIDEFWKNYMEPALKGTAAQNSQGQITALQAQNAATDVAELNATRRERETQMVEVAQRYRGSENAVCTQASIQQSLGATTELARAAASNELRARNKNATGSTDGANANGPANEALNRFASFAATYCDSNSFGGLGSKVGCTASGDQVNLDISAYEIFYGRDTNGDGKLDENDLTFDFTLDDPGEQQAADAFLKNLGTDKPFSNFNPNTLDSKDLNAAKIILAKQRENLARRSIASSSLVQFKSLFAPGTSAAAEYMKGWMSEIGRSGDLVNDTPSLYAQQRLVFRDFYSNPKMLIEKAMAESPENVQRTTFAAQAAANVQLFNIYEVLLRIDTNLAGINLTLQDDRYYAIEDETRLLKR